MTNAPHPVLVDTTSLIAYCKTNFDEILFQSLAMFTTNVCNEEVKRQMGAKQLLEHETACRRYFELYREEKNPQIEYVEEYKQHVEDQGEQTIKQVFQHNPQTIDYILLFDFDAIETLDEVKQEIGPPAQNTKISLPNQAFELLRQNGTMTDEEYCKATYQMGCAEDWMKKHAQKFDSISPINCDQFP